MPSDANAFSKLFYHLYKARVRQKWQETYRDYYNLERPHADEDSIEVCNLIRGDLMAGDLDITLPDSTGGDDALQGGSEGEEQEVDGEEVDASPQAHDDIRVPKVAVWYQNAVVNVLTVNASPSQKDAMKKYKLRFKGGQRVDSVGEAEEAEETEEERANRLNGILRFVLHVLNHVFPTTPNVSPTPAPTRIPCPNHVATVHLRKTPWFIYLMSSMQRPGSWGRSAWLVLTLSGEGS
jgi:hypothetical protein